jgi:hypothetical protein
MPRPRSHRNRVSPRNTDPARPVPAANVNLARALLLNTGGLLLMFDGPVFVDPDHPPETWSFNGIRSIQPGGLNFGDSVYLILNGGVGNGDPVVLAANDPAARTPGGGFVNGAVTVISDL